MRKRYELVMVPNEPKELKPDMLCRSNSDEADSNIFYFLDSESDLTPDGFHESVIPFIVEKDDSKDIEKEKLYVFNFKDGGCCVGFSSELSDLEEVVLAREVIVGPEQIGLVLSEGIGSNHKSEISIEDINRIMANKGWCYVEMEDEFTSPERFRNVGWGDSVPEVKLENGLCVISF